MAPDYTTHCTNSTGCYHNDDTWIYVQGPPVNFIKVSVAVREPFQHDESLYEMDE